MWFCYPELAQAKPGWPCPTDPLEWWRGTVWYFSCLQRIKVLRENLLYWQSPYKPLRSYPHLHMLFLKKYLAFNFIWDFSSSHKALFPCSLIWIRKWLTTCGKTGSDFRSLSYVLMKSLLKYTSWATQIISQGKEVIIDFLLNSFLR